MLNKAVIPFYLSCRIGRAGVSTCSLPTGGTRDTGPPAPAPAHLLPAHGRDAVLVTVGFADERWLAASEVPAFGRRVSRPPLASIGGNVGVAGVVKARLLGQLSPRNPGNGLAYRARADHGAA